MGQRTLKRVALDFHWPLDQVWEGYINPYGYPGYCQSCNGTGRNAATKQCEQCNGDGQEPCSDPILKKNREEWQEYEPPIGDGYQLWETCSEGSPVSPVFESAEDLASWCESNATTFADYKVSREKWLAMFQKDNGTDDGSMMMFTKGKFSSSCEVTGKE